MNKVELNNQVKDHLAGLADDGLTIFLLKEGTLRGALLHGTALLNQMTANHQTGPLESLVLGHAYLGAALLVNNLKGNDRIGFSIECGGPIKGLSVEADYLGNVRGYLSENPIPLTEPLESLDLSPLFGPGFLKMTKSVEGAARPFTGQVMLEYGNIGQDLAHYFLTSEQIPTSFTLSIDFDREGGILGAGGLFLQVLPGADPKMLEELEGRILSMPSLGKSFTAGITAAEFLRNQFEGFSPRILETKPVRFFCPCSRERFSSFLTSMGEEDKRSILKDGPFPLKTLCHNCNTGYTFEKEELKELLR